MTNERRERSVISRCDHLNLDEHWKPLIEDYLSAWAAFDDTLGGPGKHYHEADRDLRRVERTYDRYFVGTVPNRQTAEQLLNHLSQVEPKLQIMAHSDPTAYPPNSYWRVLSRTGKLRPLSKAKLEAVTGLVKEFHYLQ